LSSGVIRGRVEPALQRFMLRTRKSPLRLLWKGLYAGTAHGAAAWIGRPGDSVYINGSLAGGEPLYGLSDIDLIAVTPDLAGRARLERRLGRMYRVVPALRRLMAHVRVYEATELATAASNPFPTYGLGTGRAAFRGRDAPHDPAALLARPGLHAPAVEWRRLRGERAAPASERSRQDERIAAWLELQYVWRLAYLMFEQSDTVVIAARMVTLVAEASRIWLWLAANEPVAGRSAPLRRASQLLEGEREPLFVAMAVLERLPEVSAFQLPELWSCYVRLSARIAESIERELSSSGAVEVQLDGGRHPGGLPLRDWQGLALPQVRWPELGLPVAPIESFTVVGDDAMDPAVVADVATRSDGENWPSLRSGPLLLRPNIIFGAEGRLRGIETHASDPVSFALADRRATASFPEARGWSASDRALRAVAEHRAWLHQEVAPSEGSPAWVGGWPLATVATPASVSLLLSAARAALFLESIEQGAPRLTLTDEATVGSLAERAPAGAEAAEHALASLREHEPVQPDWTMLMRLRSAVIRLPPYATNVAV
jgi:hypothetical protein